MKRCVVTRPLQQLDFWPELRNPGMSLYAALSVRCVPARSVSEDGHSVRREAVAAARNGAQIPDGNHGDNLSKVRQ